MLSASELKKILKVRPSPKSIWYGEPNFGSYYTEQEIDSLYKLIKNSNNWDVGFGPNPKEVSDFEKNFSQYCGVSNSIAVSNNGDGFEMVLNAINLSSKDEVITPSLNFKAWLMIMHKFRFQLKFCDIDIESLNISIEDLEKKISRKTRLICPVHMGGISCKSKEIDEIAKYYSKKYGKKIYVIYDSARATGVHYKDNPVGKYGDCEIFSFHGAKLMTALGEGGMITTNNKILANKLRAMRSYGDEKCWGMNYRMTKIGAFMGNLQLKRIDNMNSERILIANKRIQYLYDCDDFLLPNITKKLENVFYLFPIILGKNYTKKDRDKLLKILEVKFKIICSVPKHINRRWSFIKNNYGIPKLKNTDYVYNRIFCPIMHPQITEKQNKYISAAILDSIKYI